MSVARATKMQAVFLVQHYASVAHGAMRRQYQRVIGVSPPHLDDGYLFALALADLLKAAHAARGHAAGADITKGLSDFDRSVPHAKDFRNLLEHWEAYAEGKGRAQARLGLARGRHWFWWTSTSPPILRIGGSQAGLDLDVTEAKSAGAALYQVIRKALERALRAA